MTRLLRRATLVVTAAGMAVCTAPLAGQNPAYEELQNFSSVLNHVRLNYVDSVSYRELVRAAIDGVLRSLDPHSYFAERGAWDKRAAFEAGEAAWCGITLERVGEEIVVLSVDPGGPADRSGVRPGDRLLTVADTSVAGLSAVEAEAELIGDEGTKVTLAFERGPRFEPDTLRVSLERKRPNARSVRNVRLLDQRTGYLRLTRFRADAGEELRDAIERLRDNGADRLILDLRGNPGGALNAALDVAGLFLPKRAVVFRMFGRKADTNAEASLDRAGPFQRMALVVLVDASSASASEAVAGALQDHRRAVIVGRRTFGKALAQAPFFLPGGDVVWLTIGRIWTPSGRSLQREYRNRTIEAYREDAGSPDRGRAADEDGAPGEEERGGVAPDLPVERPGAPPAWWSAALEQDLQLAVADSVAQTLPESPESRAEWLTNPDRWGTALLEPFMESARAALGPLPDPESDASSTMATLLAARVAEVRWGEDAGLELRLSTDVDVLAGLEVLSR
ncbi:MAG: S41 family peptidase [Gemmatimonadota bacterium]